MILRLTDGTTTVTLSGNGSTILGATYAPQGGGVEVARLAQAVRDGQPISRIVRANVTESAEVVLQGTTSQIEAVEASIGQLLSAALERQRSGNGAPVYVEYAKTSSSEVHRSELFYGRPLPPDEPGRRRFLASGTNTVTRVLSWERAFFWEGQEVQATSAASVVNHDDSGADNHWTVTGIVGDLPAPVRITLTNASGASQGYRRLHLASTWDGHDYVHILQGENRVSGGGTVVTDASCSNGQFNRLTVSSPTGLGTQWTLSTTLLNKTKGRWFRVLARVYRPTATLYVKPEIRDSAGVTPLWSGEEVRVSAASGGWQLIDLGRVPLPPGGYGVTLSSALRLRLACRAPASVDFEVDFVQLSPTDSWLDLEQLGYDLANGAVITVDCMQDLYHTGGWPLYVPSGGPLMVKPGVSNRFFLLEHEANNMVITNAMTVNMWYRPRRVSL